jgi:uncharacterized Zn finger protein (UPF0148 family)
MIQRVVEPAASTCPECQAPVANVQGVESCPDCEWAER